MKLSGSVAALCGILQTLAVGVLAANGSQCHCLPSDSRWPSTAAWASLNTTVGGRLIATVPIGSPCHDPTYDAAACAALQDNWTIPEIHLETSSSVMQAYFANQSCDPFTAESRPCLLGNYVSYAVNVSSASDVSAALKFAQANNVRTVIRNTGHDFFGRSTGAGALAIWTHHLQDIDFLDWSDSYYQGRAIKVGAGVLGAAAVEAADAEGLVVVTGECPTVGLAGGYTQGGGHSALSTSFGLAADQTLEFEVVTASGAVINASRTENADLFWALSGGGGGTYGVVLSLTARAHPAATIGGAVLQMAAAYTTTANFNAAVAALHAMLPNMTDLGASVVYYVSNEILVIKPVTVYNSTAAYVRDVVLAPFTAVLAELGIPAAVEYTELSYLDHYAAYMGPLPGGSIAVEAYQFGGRLIPRAVLEESNEAFQVVLQNLTANGVLAVGTAASYAAPAGADGAVLPAWRGATIQMQLTTPWNSTAPWADMVAAQLLMTDDFMPQIEAVTPGSGSYMNEADFRQPNWQEVFFGANYLPLLAIKEKWDPEGQFYILKGVGSEAWTVDGDGRMCRA